MSSTSPDIAFAYTTNQNGASLAYIDPTTKSLTDLGKFYDENDLSTPLSAIFGIAYGQDGNLYVSQQNGGDNGTTQIWKVNLPPVSNKVTLTKIGTGTGLLNVNGTVDSAAIGVHAMDIAPDGQMYALDFNGRLSTIDLTTGLATFVVQTTGGGISGAPMDMVFDSDGILYVVDGDDFYSVNTSTGNITPINSGYSESLMGLWADAEGNVYASSWTIPGKYYSIDKATGSLTELSAAVGTRPHGGDFYIAYPDWGGAATNPLAAATKQLQSKKTVRTSSTIMISELAIATVMH